MYYVMFVIEKLKLNKHKVVSVPRNRDLYERVGGRVPNQGTTGFQSEYGKDKMQILADSEQAIMQEYLQELDKRKMPLADGK